MKIDLVSKSKQFFGRKRTWRFNILHIFICGKNDSEIFFAKLAKFYSRRVENSTHFTLNESLIKMCRIFLSKNVLAKFLQIFCTFYSTWKWIPSKTLRIFLSQISSQILPKNWYRSIFPKISYYLWQRNNERFTNSGIIFAKKWKFWISARRQDQLPTISSSRTTL